MESLTTALTTGMSTASSNIMTSMGAILPSALAIFGAFMLIRMAVRTFKTGAK